MVKINAAAKIALFFALVLLAFSSTEGRPGMPVEDLQDSDETNDVEVLSGENLPNKVICDVITNGEDKNTDCSGYVIQVLREPGASEQRVVVESAPIDKKRR